MSFTRLLLRNLLSHWRGNLPVLLGVAVGAAVLTGALLVGDSLRGSLRDQALEQLGWVDEALVANRFFREELAANLPAGRTAPAMLLQISATATGPSGFRFRANQVTLLAVDDRFWPEGQVPVDTKFWREPTDGVVLNSTLAKQLGVHPGDKVALLLQTTEEQPRETLMGKRKNEDVLSTVEVTVRAILPDQGMARFTLRPGPGVPLNAFVPLRLLQDRYDPVKKTAPLKGRINAILVGEPKENLDKALVKNISLRDWNLALRTPEERGRDWARLLSGRTDRTEDWDGKLRKFLWQGRVPEALAKRAGPGNVLTAEQFADYVAKEHGYLSLESKQMFVEPPAAQAAEKTAARLGWRSAATLVYLIDTIAAGKQETHYAVAAALDPRLAPPLGPIQPTDQPPLKKDQVLLVNWPENPLTAQAGQKLTLEYYLPDSSGQLYLQKVELELAGRVPLQGAADDPDLTPRFEGITDKLDMFSWEETPFPLNRKWITKADNDYWKRYRTVPKAYVTLETGQRLWGSRFGQVTSLRLVPGKSENFAHAAEMFEKAMLAELPPAAGGFIFNDVKKRSLAAGQGSNDFAGLFLGFSSFLIIAALLLVGLLVRLSLDQRAREIGLLLAVGWPRGRVRWLVLAEGTVLAIFGGAVGIGGAILYARLLLDYLRDQWPGGLEHGFLELHVDPLSCVIGYASALAVSILTILWATWALARVAPRALLQGETTAQEGTTTSRPPRASKWVAALAALGAANCLAVGMVSEDQEIQASCFMGSGMLVLTALLAGLWIALRHLSQRPTHSVPGLVQLGFRNAARHPVRSLLTVGLLGSASFLVVAVEVFHRDPGLGFAQVHGGSGGFNWVGETNIPVFADPQTPKGRADLNLPAANAALDDATIVPFRVHGGEDVSCLNLYKPSQPRLFGVPQTLIQHGGFHFAASEARTDEERANPWLLLRQKRDDGAVPAIGEASSVTYILGSGLGKEIEVLDGRGQKVRLRIVAMLENSVFQSGLLVSDEHFLHMYPRQEGFQFFLIDAPEKVRPILEEGLADYGFSMTPSKDRLQSYLDVENTYLSTFQALGGLGLLLGTLGLAIVLVRSVWERRGELALLRALGFRRTSLGLLVLAENVWLLVLGLGSGIVAAAVAVTPYLATQAGTVSVGRLAIFLGLVLGIGLVSGAAAMAATLRAPLIPALRRD